MPAFLLPLGPIWVLPRRQGYGARWRREVLRRIRKRINQFARATGDDQWIHVDVARAGRELPTGSTIAHGLLTLGFAPVFVRSVMHLEGVKNTLNYGANRVRYLAPVPVGSRLRGRVSIAAAENAPRPGLRVTYGVTIEVENHQRPACVVEIIAVHYR